MMWWGTPFNLAIVLQFAAKRGNAAGLESLVGLCQPDFLTRNTTSFLGDCMEPAPKITSLSVGL